MSTFLMILGQVPSELTTDLLLLCICPLYTLLPVNTAHTYSNTDYFSRSSFFTRGMCQAVSTPEQQPVFIQRTSKLQAVSGKPIPAYIHSMDVVQPHTSSEVGTDF